MRLMAMENGITVWSATTLVRGSEVSGAAAAPSTADMAAESRVLRWPSAVQRLQNTQSQVSQNSSSWLGWEEHLGTTSLRWRAIRSRSWLTRKEGGRFWTPPVGMVMSSRHTGHLNTVSVYTRREMREIRGPDSGPGAIIFHGCGGPASKGSKTCARGSVAWSAVIKPPRSHNLVVEKMKCCWLKKMQDGNCSDRL